MMDGNKTECLNKAGAPWLIDLEAIPFFELWSHDCTVVVLYRKDRDFKKDDGILFRNKAKRPEHFGGVDMVRVVQLVVSGRDHGHTEDLVLLAMRHPRSDEARAVRAAF